MAMKRHRMWLVAAFCWFSLLAALVPVSGAPFVFPYVLAWALLLVLSPAARKLPLWIVGGAAWAIYIAVGDASALPLDTAHLLTVAVSFLGLPIAKALGQCEDSFESAVRFSMKEGLSAPRSIDVDHSSLYVELRRARTHERPVSLLAVSPADLGDADVDRLVAEVVRKNVSCYVQASLASLLSEEMRDFDVLAARGDHFVLMLPETGSEQAMEFVRRLRERTRERLGLELEIGLSSFPAQEVTLGALLKSAESSMLAGAEPTVVAESTLGARMGSRPAA